MDFFKYLKDTFGEDQPFFLYEVNFEHYSYPWINKRIKELLNDKKIARYDKGIYYIPTETAIGPSSLSYYDVIEKKYLKCKDITKGYYCGKALLNTFGILNQVSNRIEIRTNSETSKNRKVFIDGYPITLKKPRARITTENVNILTFLEMINYIDSVNLDQNRKNVVIKYIKEKNITKDGIQKYIGYFPSHVSKNLIKTGLIYEIA